MRKYEKIEKSMFYSAFTKTLLDTKKYISKYFLGMQLNT